LLDPEECERVQSCLNNKEPFDLGCQACYIKDLPPLDELSLSALYFSNLWDDEAHEHYRAALWELLAPALSPSHAMSWLTRRSVIYNERKKIAYEETEREHERRRREAHHGHTP
jgi:hypothetical protein